METVTYPSYSVSLSCGVSRLVTLLVAGTSEWSTRSASRGSTPIVTAGALSRATVCGASNTLVENGPLKPIVYLRVYAFLTVNSKYSPMHL